MGMEFVGRADELAVLEEEYARGDGFVVLYGRRRVGKTTLIKRFIEGKRALYFLASKEDDAINLRRFTRKAAEFTGDEVLANATFSDWRAPFEAIVRSLGGAPCVIAIDEFPYLVSSNKALPSVMQGIWDETLAGRGVMLILCGSSVSMMHDEVLSAKSPLYGRRSAQIQLKPFSFAETRLALPHASYERAVQTYAICGGVPKYLEFFCSGASLMALVKRHALSSAGYLYQEPEFLLAEETRGVSSYLSILGAIAQGNRKVSELTAFLGRKATDVSPYLATLMGLGFVERSAPFNERYPKRSKNGLYSVSDGYMRFWLTYVQPFAAELEMGNMQPSLEALQRTFKSQFVAFSFERVSAEDLARLCAAGIIGFTPSRIAGYWNRNGTVELDVCADDNARDMSFLGECKYRERKPIDMADYRALAKKAQAVPSRPGGMLLGLFSAMGFSDDLLQLAGHDEQLVLVNQGTRVA